LQSGCGFFALSYLNPRIRAATASQSTPGVRWHQLSRIASFASSSLQVKPSLPHPEDVAARKALAAMPPAPLERVLRQAEASRRWNSDQLRESRSKHPLNTHAEAIAQIRGFREAMDESAARCSPSSSTDCTAAP